MQNAEPSLVPEILVCSAWEPEQRVLRDFFGAQIESRPSDQELAILRGTTAPLGHDLNKPRDPRVSFCLLGTGSISAAATLGGFLGARVGHGEPLPRLAVFVGTAGAMRQAAPVPAPTLPFAATVSTVSWFDLGEATGQGYLPTSQRNETVLPSYPGTDPSPLPQGSCVSTWAITRSLPENTVRPGWLENLELYGFALTCQRFGIPWRAWLGVSNWTGTQAHQEWVEHHLTASALAQAAFYAAAFGGGSSSKPR